ncbi:MAG: MOSC domain-containing protein [Beijerinckiaceae bacterium]
MTIRPPLKLAGRVEALYATTDKGSFETAAVGRLELGFEGISGDRHGGFTRRSGGREPWYPRGTEMRNERQLSIVSPDELAEAAQEMGVPEIRPQWIGGNMLVTGIPRLTMLPPRTCLFFAGGVTIRIDGLNVPCRFAGRGIAQHFPDRSGLDLEFVKAARRRRGLVGWVEKPGVIAAGEALEARLPEQWIYGVE